MVGFFYLVESAEKAVGLCAKFFIFFKRKKIKGYRFYPFRNTNKTTKYFFKKTLANVF